ncbi:MAG: hypothetical protein AAF211_34425, partial [Myxococcota bacterium]
PMSWPTRGTTIKGTVVGIRETQATDYKTKQPEHWPDGSPKMVPIVTVQTEQHEDAEDDGRRDIYLRAGLYTAFREILKKTFTKSPSDDELLGATLTMQFYKEVPASGGGNPRKLFRAKLEPKPPEPERSADFGWDDEPAPTTQPQQRTKAEPPPEGGPPWAGEDWASDEDI